MGKIRISVVAGAPLEKVYKIARETDSYPSLMDSLKQLEVVECNPDGSCLRTRWTAQTRIILTTRQMCWVQKDTWDAEKHLCSFEVDHEERGHFKRMAGTWRFNPHPKGTEMIMEMDFQLNHPLLTPTIHKIIDGIMEKNNKSLLTNIKLKAESQARGGKR
jgi:ribosome-associated toxin RatA of RatAB toxin-antitoxin module